MSLCPIVVVSKLKNCPVPRAVKRLHNQGVNKVSGYADTDKTTKKLSGNFEGFSQILKEQSGEKRYLGVFTNPIAII